MTNWYDNVTAPTDANGELVPLDTRELVYKGETRDVLRIAYSVAIGRWVAELAYIDEHPSLTNCTLPDSWERLERDVMDTRDVKWSLVSCRYYRHDTEDSCVGCPARSDDNCENSVLVDIVRRAKALAGVTDDE